MKNAVVTGASGFLGNRLVQRLVSDGVPVTAIVRQPTPDRQFAELTQAQAIDQFLTPDTTIFHLAASANVSASVSDPASDFQNTLLSTFQVLESARRFGCRVVFTSSTCVFDASNPLPFKEEGLFRPASPYGAAKLAGEGYCFAYHRSYGLDTRIARITNVYGPGMRRFAIADFVKKMRANHREITIVGDGTQIRDYLYIDDAVQALLTIARCGHAGSDYNVGSGKPVQIIEVLREIAQILGCPDIRIRTTNPMVGDLACMHVETEKLRSIGFRAAVPFRIGLQRTVASLLHSDPDSITDLPKCECSGLPRQAEERDPVDG